jgi:uncharacterized protein YdhG (YjbR/CyaY superfamily)
MPQSSFRTVDEYLAAQPAAARPILRRVRAALRRALPTADEVLSYKIPAYRLPGGVAIFFAGWKAHYSIYPASAALVATFKRQLAPYEVNDKGTIRFPLTAPVPVRLLSALARFRGQELAAKAAPKTAPRTAPRPAPKTAPRTTPKRPAAKPATSSARPAHRASRS